MQLSEYRVPSMNIESPYGGGVSSLPSATGSLLPVKFPAAPVLLSDGPQLGSWQIDVSEVTGNVRPVVPAGGSPLAGVVNPAGPVGPCETPSPSSDFLDTVESLEHAVVETILDGRPMEGITCPELLEHSLRLLDTTLDGGLVEKISDWELAESPVPDTTLDGRLTEGTTYLEHSVLGVSLDSGLMAGMSCLEPLEQSVLNTLLVARPVEVITETDTLERSALASQVDYGQSESESQSRSLVDVALDCRTMDGISVPLSIESSGLALAPDSGHVKQLPSSGPLEHST